MLRGEAKPSTISNRAERSGSYWAISLRRLYRKKIAMFFLGVILLMYGSGILASLVAPYGYNDQDLTNVKQGPSLSHPFGTD